MCTVDVDECSINAELCSHGQCINYPGGYRCECDMGFTSTDKERTCVGMYIALLLPTHCPAPPGPAPPRPATPVIQALAVFV